jgi:hypothetical protein
MLDPYHNPDDDPLAPRPWWDVPWSLLTLALETLAFLVCLAALVAAFIVFT